VTDVAISSTVRTVNITSNIEAGGKGEGVPAGGTTHQVLRKINGTDFNSEWADPEGGITAGDIVVGEDSVGSEYDLEIGQTAAEDIYAGIVKPLLLNKPGTGLKTVIGGVFDAFGILGAVFGCIHDVARAGATRALYGIVGDDAGAPSFKANAQFDHDGTTGISTSQFISNGISVSLTENGAGESIFDTSAANSARIRSYANLSAITTAIGTPQEGMLVRVVGQGLAVYTGSTWNKASDDTTAIT